LPAYAHIDESRIGLAHFGVTEIKPPHCGRAIVVDEHVGAGAKPQQRRPRRRLFQIEHHAALVAVELQKQRAHAGVLLRAAGAHQIAARRLDLDDVGAVIGENLRGIRAKHHRGEVDDAQSVQRRWLGHRRFQ
jgi:hypothetical protein